MRRHWADAIVAAIRGGDVATVTQVGAALKAGTQCGAWRPEIAALLAAQGR